VSATLSGFPASYQLSITKNDHKEAAMHILALSTLLFHAVATVAMVLGVAANACFPIRR
jgi:hypothetical protein